MQTSASSGRRSGPRALPGCICPRGGGATPRVLGRQLPLAPPPPPPRGLRPTVSCQRCRPQASMGGEGARCYMSTKGALRKILSNLHPNTILKPSVDSNTHLQPSAYSYPYT